MGRRASCDRFARRESIGTTMYRAVRVLAAMGDAWTDRQLAIHLGVALLDAQAAIAEAMLQDLLYLHRGMYAATEKACSLLRADCRQRQPGERAWKIEARTGMRADGSQSAIDRAAIPGPEKRVAKEDDE